MRKLIMAAVAWAGISCLGIMEAEVVRLPEAEAKKAVVQRVDPEYPPIAKQMRVSGRVQVDVYIDEQGNVEKVEGSNGNPILTAAAANAVKKWKFTPVTSGGKAAKAVTTLTFDFKL